MKRTRSLLGTLTVISLLAALIPLGAFPVAAATVVINEVDSVTPGANPAEFVELYDGGVGNTALDGLVIVFYDGTFDTVYGIVDLDGIITDAAGYAVVCGLVSADFVPNCDIDAPVDLRPQNIDNAVALYSGNGSDFRGNGALHTNGVLDAVVIGVNDTDTGLLSLLNPNQPQVDEAGGNDILAHSNQRCPNGEGGLRNTSSYSQFAPTVRALNGCGTSTTTTTTTTTQPTTTSSTTTTTTTTIPPTTTTSSTTTTTTTTIPPTTTTSSTTTTTTTQPTTTTTAPPAPVPQPGGSATADTRPPRVHVELDRIWGRHNEGWYRVDFECRDKVDRHPTCVAELNGIRVRDGQKVYLVRTSRPASSILKGHVLYVRANSFELRVTATDASGNTATATVRPGFWRGRTVWWCR